MCLHLYLATPRALPPIAADARYPELTIAAVEEWPLERIRRLIPEARYAYTVAPGDLCGCYFGFPARTDLEEDLAAAPDLDHLVSTITYPELDPLEAARQWWAWKRTAVISFGHYLADHVHDTPVLLYVVWEGEEGLSAVERHTITPAFFTHADRLSLSGNQLLTIVPDSARAPAATVPTVRAP